MKVSIRNGNNLIVLFNSAKFNSAKSLHTYNIDADKTSSKKCTMKCDGLNVPMRYRRSKLKYLDAGSTILIVNCIFRHFAMTTVNELS